jgi:hypothetical protein
MNRRKFPLVCCLTALLFGCSSTPIAQQPYPTESWDAFKARHSSYQKSCDEHRIKITMTQHQPNFYIRYNEALSKFPTMAGTIVLALAIKPNGTTAEVAVVRESVQSPRFINKVKQHAKTMWFPPTSDTQGCVTDFTLNFYRQQ